MNLAKKTEFIYDKKGNKTGVIMPIRKYEQLIEDLADLKAIEAVRHEKPISLSEIKKQRAKKRKNG